jgi:hypothetical protein
MRPPTFLALSLFVPILIAIFVFSPLAVSANSFGITPPYVRNDSLTRNSIYEQKISLVRSDPNMDMLAQLIIDVPGAEDWISIDKGTEFILPEGEQRVDMIVRLQIPNRAPFDNYTGRIRIRTVPADGSRAGEGAVSISLGAQVAVNFDIIDKKIFDFKVWRVRLPDLNEGRKILWLTYPGKIRFNVEIENTGNVPVAPSRVTMDIYNITGEELLEQTRSTNRMKRIQPFKTEEVEAHLPTHLPPGNYVARYVVYNQDEIKLEGELSMNIREDGTVVGLSGYGFMGLSLRDKATILVPVLILLLIAVTPYTLGIIKKRKKRSNNRVTLEPQSETGNVG